VHFLIGLLVGSLMGWLLDWLVGRARKQDLAKRLAQLEQREQEWQVVRVQLQQQLAGSSSEIQMLKQKLADREQEILTLNELLEEYSIRLDRAETTNQDWMGRWDTAQAELEELRMVVGKGDSSLPLE
jgi:chromosome segregation ATPase